MSSTSIGRAAEQAAADFLVSKGLKISALNWRTRRCEIDIVAAETKRFSQKPTVIHFVEVKFRASEQQGTGINYITPTKLKQMNFAAENWIYENDWQGDYQLDVIGVSLKDQSWQFEFIENISI